MLWVVMFDIGVLSDIPVKWSEDYSLIKDTKNDTLGDVVVFLERLIKNTDKDGSTPAYLKLIF